MFTKTIINGNRAVIINEMSGGRYYANVYVNCRNADVLDWDITTIRKEYKGIEKIEAWANHQLGFLSDKEAKLG